jgi:hypothetical protein
MNVSAVAQGEGQGRGFQKIAPTSQPDRGQKTEGAEADGGDLDRTGIGHSPAALVRLTRNRSRRRW